jgi:nitrite reductase/ring-hydroxylating ferredoxin subunit
LVRAGLPARGPAAVHRSRLARDGSGADRDRLRQVGNDQRNCSRDGTGGHHHGHPPDWATTFNSNRVDVLASAGSIAAANADVAVHLAVGWLRPDISVRTPDEGQGVVERRGIGKVARSCVDGATHTVSAKCTHIGGVVDWNDAEQSWDCPLHGSRFAPDGSVLEGPATHALRPVEN